VIDLPILRLDPDLPLPSPMRAGDAAIDLPARASCAIEPGARGLVPTGFAIALPVGWCGLILPRSGLALHHGVTVLNSPGLIDSGYRGELKVILVNTGDAPARIERGDRIAQLLVQPVPEVRLAPVDELPPAVDDRGTQGFGSSG
jgi:dUTP pyrophosphatase